MAEEEKTAGAPAMPTPTAEPAPAEEPAPIVESEQDGPQDWPQGSDYDPREDPGPVRVEDEVQE